MARHCSTVPANAAEADPVQEDCSWVSCASIAFDSACSRSIVPRTLAVEVRMLSLSTVKTANSDS